MNIECELCSHAAKDGFDKCPECGKVFEICPLCQNKLLKKPSQPLYTLLVEIREFLEKSRQPHYYCEDSWYSCPKAEDGCANDKITECNCGADEYNAKLDIILQKINKLIDKGK
jgi:hypothetical protein